jgi:hypothetical protein
LSTRRARVDEALLAASSERWQELHTSTRSSSTVARVWKVFPHPQVTVQFMYLGGSRFSWPL